MMVLPRESVDQDPPLLVRADYLEFHGRHAGGVTLGVDAKRKAEEWMSGGKRSSRFIVDYLQEKQVRLLKQAGGHPPPIILYTYCTAGSRAQ
jgi:hypothetical protein